MTLRDTLTDDASSVFLNTDEFAESVTYKPRGSVTTRPIRAVVEREQLATVNEDGGETVAPMFIVHVANDSTLGISSDELDTGGDKISLPVRDGMTASYRAITRLISQDNGMLVLECR